MRTALLVFLSYAAAGQRPPDVPRGWKQFVAAKVGYVAYYPGDWHLLDASSPTLDVASFRPSQAVHAVVVPANGATISIVSAPYGISSIDQWIARDSDAHRVESRTSFNLERAAHAPLQVSEVDFGSIEGPDTTSWYFDLNGQLLVAHLSYWKPNRNEGKYRDILKFIIRTLRLAVQ